MWRFMQSCSFAAAPMRPGPLFSTRLRICSELHALMAAAVFQLLKKHPQAKNGRKEVRKHLFFQVTGPEATCCPPKMSERAKPLRMLGIKSHESGLRFYIGSQHQSAHRRMQSELRRPATSI